MKLADQSAFPCFERVFDEATGKTAAYMMETGFTKFEVIAIALLANNWRAFIGNENFMRSSIGKAIQVAKLICDELEKV